MKTFFTFILQILPVLLSASFSSCKGNNSIDKEEVQRVESISSNDLEEINMSQFKKYQTFDEFNLRGEGKVQKEPYVYVKRNHNRIVVLISDNLTDSLVYEKKQGVWMNFQELDLNKINNQIAKDGEMPARRYWRYFINDSIIEYREMYYGQRTQKHLFIKTKDKCIYIMLLSKLDVVNKKDRLQQIHKLIDKFKYNYPSFVQPVNNIGYPNARMVNTYRIIKKPLEYLYEIIGGKGTSYVFERNSLGFLGIQPGLDKIDERKSFNYNFQQ